MDLRLRTVIVNKANSHWDWMGRLFELIGYSKDQIKVIEYVYKTAFLHGAKHAEEELENERRERDSYADFERAAFGILGGSIPRKSNSGPNIVSNMEDSAGGEANGVSRGSEEAND